MKNKHQDEQHYERAKQHVVKGFQTLKKMMSPATYEKSLGGTVNRMISPGFIAGMMVPVAAVGMVGVSVAAAIALPVAKHKDHQSRAERFAREATQANPAVEAPANGSTQVIFDAVGAPAPAVQPNNTAAPVNVAEPVANQARPVNGYSNDSAANQAREEEAAAKEAVPAVSSFRS